MNFRISKERREIDVALSDGRDLKGFVFLEQSMVNPGEPIRVLELLEAEERFLPFTTPQGEFLILPKSSIVCVHVATEHELRSMFQTGIEAYETTELSVRITHHDAVAGTLYIEPIEGFSRPFDQINRTKSFLTIQGKDQTSLINVQHIVEIQILPK